MNVLFFAAAGASDAGDLGADARYHVALWRPTLTQTRPSGMPLGASTVWWAMHRLQLFANPEYGQVVVRDAAGVLVHRAGIFPRWFRFPFMQADDLQIGDTWTHPDHRGRGLASQAIRYALRRLGKPGRTIWYLTTPDNEPSIRAALAGGLRLTGHGTRVPRLGLRALGAFILAPRADAHPNEREHDAPVAL